METAVLTVPETLAEMRKKAGLTSTEVGRLLAERLGRRRPYSHARIIQIEGSGTDSDRIMEALASIYSCDYTDIRAAVKKVRR